MSKYGETVTQLGRRNTFWRPSKRWATRSRSTPRARHLNSYYAEQEAKVANIIIRRDQLRGAYGDVGFVRQPDGQFAMIKDELDEYRGYGARWLGRVQQLYKEKQTLAMARAKGYTLKSREVIETSQGEQVRLQFVARR